jgi:hypothetical protein
VLLGVAYAPLLRRVHFGRSFWGTSGRLARACSSSVTPPIRPTPTTMRLLAQAVARPRLSSRAPGSAAVHGRRHLTNNGFFRVSEEVREALHAKKPVVALETTIYTHGRHEQGYTNESIANWRVRLPISRECGPRIPPRKRS